ncbi:MAG: NUDIX hydrolase [Thermoleophilia bacterium]|nr:NUDIX hydrolase [Thermoleophilia bacterium]
MAGERVPGDSVPPGTQEDLPVVVGSRSTYAGAVVSIRIDRLRRSDNELIEREVVDHPGAVVIAALDARGKVVLVRQYRHAVGRTLLELPAGTLDPGEDPADAAVRELREETGLIAAKWDSLGSFFSSPGFLHEELHAFLARDLTTVGQDLDDDEDIHLVTESLADLLTTPEVIRDAKTLATLLLLERLLAAEGAHTETAEE